MNPSADTKNWYLIYTKCQAEQKALNNLERQGYCVYLPKINIDRRRRGKYITKIEPMFLRYLFIQLNCTTDDWSPIRSTQGVAAIVRFSEYPLKVPDSLIETLKNNENVHGIQKINAKKVEKGDKVSILEGAMAGCEGIFESELNNDRVIILLKIAGQDSRANVSKHNLQFES